METYVISAARLADRRGPRGRRGAVDRRRRAGCPTTSPGSAATCSRSGRNGRHVCIYQASSPEAIRRHAAAADLPVDEIVKVADTVIVRPDPSRDGLREGERCKRRFCSGR